MITCAVKFIVKTQSGRPAEYVNINLTRFMSDINTRDSVYEITAQTNSNGEATFYLPPGKRAKFQSNQIPGFTLGKWIDIPNTAEYIAGSFIVEDASQSEMDKVSAEGTESFVAAKTYADGLVVGLLDDRGNYDASVNTFPDSGGSGSAGAIKKGDLYRISVAGTLGGVPVQVGDSVRALVDTPGQTAGNWGVLDTNETLATLGALIASASSATLDDTDIIPVIEGTTTKNSTLTAIKAFLKTYFDSIYAIVENIVELQGAINSKPSSEDVLLKADNLSGIPDLSAARGNLGLDSTANQESSTDKNFVTEAQLAAIENIPEGGTILAVPVNNTVLAATTGTVYSSPGSLATPLTVTNEGMVPFPVPRPGTIRNLYVRTGTTAKVNSPTTDIRLRVNGANSGIRVVMIETVSTTTADTANSVAVVAGDLVTISFIVDGLAAASTSIAGVSFELV